MRRFASLRARLVGSTLAASLAAVAVFNVVGDRETPSPPPLLDTEPYQDSLVLAAFTLVLSVLLWLVSAWSLRPLLRASREAGAIGPDHPDRRLSGDDLPSEMRPLARAMNGALDRLAEALRAEQRFTAAAAHELRTPLAVLSLRLRRARETGETDWTAIETDLAAVTRRVNQLLDLARVEGGTRAPEPVNLARVAREAAASVLPLVETAGRSIAVDAPAALVVNGRARDLADMIRNLLENALHHGRGGIALRLAEAAAQALVEVGDDGDGVPAADRETVFERFRAGATGGAGLGLAIVREVARSHGGEAVFLDRPGCWVEIRLPLANAMGRASSD